MNYTHESNSCPAIINVDLCYIMHIAIRGFQWHKTTSFRFTGLLKYSLNKEYGKMQKRRNLTSYRVAQRLAHLCTPYNFVKYSPISKLFFTVYRIGKRFVIILSLKIPAHLKYVATLPYEMSVS